MAIPFILHEISWSPSWRLIGFDFVPLFRMSDDPLSLRSLIIWTVSPFSRVFPYASFTILSSGVSASGMSSLCHSWPQVIHSWMESWVIVSSMVQSGQDRLGMVRSKLRVF